MHDPAIPEPDARLRATFGPEQGVRLHARSLTLTGLGRASWAATAEHPSALDYLLAALATDLVSGLGEESRRAGLVLEDVELRLEAFLEHPLVIAGVVGEEGSPRLRKIRGSLYVGTQLGAAELEALWRRACARAPVLASLAPGVSFDLTLKLVPRGRRFPCDQFS
jgi:hypothetical protein